MEKVYSLEIDIFAMTPLAVHVLYNWFMHNQNILKIRRHAMKNFGMQGVYTITIEGCRYEFFFTEGKRLYYGSNFWWVMDDVYNEETHCVAKNFGKGFFSSVALPVAIIFILPEGIQIQKVDQYVMKILKKTSIETMKKMQEELYITSLILNYTSGLHKISPDKYYLIETKLPGKNLDEALSVKVSISTLSQYLTNLAAVRKEAYQYQWKQLPWSSIKIYYLLMINHINAIHERGYVYMDFRPHNILIDLKEETLHLCDYGITVKEGDPIEILSLEGAGLEILLKDGPLLANKKMDIHYIAWVMAKLCGCRKAERYRNTLLYKSKPDIRKKILACESSDLSDISSELNLPDSVKSRVVQFWQQMVSKLEERPSIKEVGTFFMSLCTKTEIDIFYQKQKKILPYYTQEHQKFLQMPFTVSADEAYHQVKKFRV